MTNYYNLTTAMPQKIKADKEYPFYQAYHDVKYILRHDTNKQHYQTSS